MKNYVIKHSYIHGLRMVFGKKRTCLLFNPLFWHTRGHLLLVCSVFSIILTTLVLQMILKSMSVECNKTDMDNYAGDVDEEESGKFTFVQFCSVRNDNLWLLIISVGEYENSNLGDFPRPP